MLITRKEVDTMNTIIVNKIIVSKIFISLLLVAALFAYSSTQNVLGVQFQGPNPCPVVVDESHASSRAEFYESNVSRGKFSSRAGLYELRVVPKADEKTYEQFIADILTASSTIDPKLWQVYCKDYIEPWVLEYPQVEWDNENFRFILGRLVRDNSGNPEYTRLDYQGYFYSIGVEHLYTYASSDPDMFKRMQYAAVDYLGYVGASIGDRDLMNLGYYKHTQVFHRKIHEVFHLNLPNSEWANGIQSRVVNTKYGEAVVTDVNTWDGEFTGKNGINSLDDLRTDLQEYVIKDRFSYEYDRLEKLLVDRGTSVDAFIGKTIRWSDQNPPLNPPDGKPDDVTLTRSGILAGTMVNGAEGVVTLLLNNINQTTEPSIDRRVQYVLGYVQDFAGYDVPPFKSSR